MHLEDFITRARERFPDCTLGDGADLSVLDQTEERLNVTLPKQIREFYSRCNGALFPDPFLRILPLAELEFVQSGSLLEFCHVGGEEKIVFETAKLNEAGQWFILGLTEKRRVTFTMASFWSSKIWGWLEHGRPIWSENEYERSEQGA